MASPAAISANAVIPDQLCGYVRAVSGLEPGTAANCLLWHGGGHAVLAAYPQPQVMRQQAIDEAVAAALQAPGLEQITVLSPLAPAGAPPEATVKHDQYWQITLPAQAPQGKCANMLRRAAREATVQCAAGDGAFTREHMALAEAFCQRKKGIDADSQYLYAHLGDYVSAVPDALLFSARRIDDGSLAAFAIGDFSALATCFYMFACRAQNAPPGSADLLLARIIAEGEKRGHARLNLGLGIDAGIEFFKKKWGAVEFLPLIETSWQPRRKRGFLTRLFGGR